jgi:opacity protein-like surface antigen
MGLAYARGRRFNSLAIRGELGVLYHLSPDRTARQPYFRPFVALDYDRHTSDNGPGGEPADGSGGSLELGGGVGVKLPVTSRLTVRLEGSYSRFSLSGWGVLGLSTGISFYAR